MDYVNNYSKFFFRIWERRPKDEGSFAAQFSFAMHERDIEIVNNSQSVRSLASSLLSIEHASSLIPCTDYIIRSKIF